MRRIGLRTAAAILLTLLALFGGLLFAPRWINLDAVRVRIMETASRAFGARLSCERIELAFFPRPRVVLHRAKVLIPGIADGTVETLKISPTIISLFRKEFRLAEVQADAPDFRITLPSTDNAHKKPLTLRELREKSAKLLTALSDAIPGAVIELSRGRLTLLRDGIVLYDATGLSARIDAPPGRLDIEIACASSLWERLTAKVRLDPDGLKATGTFRVTHLAGDKLAPFLPPHPALVLSGAFPDAEADFECADFRTLRADFKGSVPAISVRRSARRIDARDIRFSGAIRLDEKALALNALRLSASAPRLDASGDFHLDFPTSRATASLHAGNVNIGAARETLLSFAGDLDPLPDIFDWLRGGTIPSLDISSQGRFPSGLATLAAMRLRASLRDALIHVGPGNLDLEAVRGDVSLDGGALKARGISASLGNSRTSDASVAVSFARKGTPFRVEAPLHADLSQLPGVMARLPLPAEAAALFADISSLEGSATGRLTLEGDDSGVRTAVAASSIRLAGRHRRVPLPFTVSDGFFALSGDTIRLTGHSGTLGRTKFSAVSGRMKVGGDYPVDNVSGRVEADPGEISAWVATSPWAASATGGITASGGTLDLSVSRLEGALLRPQSLRFEGTGTMHELRLSGGKLPGPLTLHSGKVTAAADSLAFEALRGSLLDAELAGSGAWTGIRGERHAVEASGLGGILGPESVRRLMALGKLPPAFSPRAPVTLSGVRLMLADDNTAALSGSFSVTDGPVVTLDLSGRPGALEIRSASLRDADSDATGSLSHTPGGLTLRFAGHLAASSVSRLFPGREPGNEWIAGDIRLRIPRDNVVRIHAKGTLEARSLHFPELLGPLTVSRLSLEAAGVRLTVGPADLAWDGKPFTLKGTLVNGTDGITADLDVHASTFSWEEIEHELARYGPAPGTSARPWRLPVTGTVRVTADAFTWKTFAWKPFRADVGLAPQAVSVVVNESKLCGIETSGAIRVTPEGTSVDLKATAADQPVEASLACMGEKDFRMTGTYTLSAHVTGVGRGDALVSSLHGPLSFEARKGRIHKANVLMKVLALLNVTQILVGKVPDLAEDGFAYNSLKIKGELANGRIKVPHLVLDAASANIAAEGEVDISRKTVDAVLVASPFKTVDSIIRLIPIVRYILKGRLVAVPFKVSGPLGDPGVSIIPTAGVGSGLLGILERTLKLPVHLIEPLLPDQRHSTPK